MAVVDVRMPPGFRDEGLKAALEARRRRPGLAVLVLSQYVEERYGRELLESGMEGTGYLLKDRVADVAEFVSALESVATGGTVLDPEVVVQLLARRRHNEGLASLTPREGEVLALVADGRTNQAIADALFVTGGAVESTSRVSSASSGCPRARPDTAACWQCWPTCAARRARDGKNAGEEARPPRRAAPRQRTPPKTSVLYTNLCRTMIPVSHDAPKRGIFLKSSGDPIAAHAATNIARLPRSP